MLLRSAAWVITVSVCVGLALACSRFKEEPPTEPTATAPTPPPLPAPKATVFDFEDDATNRVPRGFIAALNGGGGAIDWRVQEREGSPSGSKVVAQLSTDKTNGRYPHIVHADTLARDIELSVSFKTISGNVDASGGLVFRYRDKDNFYVVRANSLENNVVAYKTEGGKRSNIGVKGKDDAYGVEFEILHRRWNRLRVIATGSLFEVFVNGHKLFEVEDDTFADAGKVGLWTKADAVTEFDDFRVKTLD